MSDLSKIIELQQRKIGKLQTLLDEYKQWSDAVVLALTEQLDLHVDDEAIATALVVDRPGVCNTFVETDGKCYWFGCTSHDVLRGPFLNCESAARVLCPHEGNLA